MVINFRPWGTFILKTKRHSNNKSTRSPLFCIHLRSQGCTRLHCRPLLFILQHWVHAAMPAEYYFIIQQNPKMCNIPYFLHLGPVFLTAEILRSRLLLVQSRLCPSATIITSSARRERKEGRVLDDVLGEFVQKGPIGVFILGEPKQPHQKSLILRIFCRGREFVSGLFSATWSSEVWVIKGKLRRYSSQISFIIISSLIMSSRIVYYY